MTIIREEKVADVAAREALLDKAYGTARFAKASERLREGRLPASGLSFVAIDSGRLVGTVRLWNIVAGPGRDALLLGPLAVHPDCRNRGIGRTLMRRAIARARLAGHAAIVLVGDLAYYGRFGFSAASTGELRMPGRCERDRLLALELKPGALAGARGPISPTGTATLKPDLKALVAAELGARAKPEKRLAPMRRAA
jgi:predicted N-acetyltransferase YhbS